LDGPFAQLPREAHLHVAVLAGRDVHHAEAVAQAQIVAAQLLAQGLVFEIVYHEQAPNAAVGAGGEG